LASSKCPDEDIEVYFVKIGLKVQVFIFWGKKASQLVACKGHMRQLAECSKQKKNLVHDTLDNRA
jgi:hypothetical protein